VALRAASVWQSSEELAARAQIGKRTARAYSRKLLNLGMLEVFYLSPGRRYRLAREISKQGLAYQETLEQAAEVFGL
jgi:hypothetical protein